MNKSWQISRRTLLRGAGAAMALPWLEAMGPLGSTARAARPGGPPVRMAFFYINNGIYMPDWTPQGEGYKYALSPDLKALEPVRKDVLVLSHLANAPKQVGGRGGDHVRSRGAYLTGNTIGAPGEEVRNAISVDQLAAKANGHETYLPSLECGNVTLRADGTCDSNSCAYHTTISWRSPTTPMPMERNPRMIFDRMFRDRRARPCRIGMLVWKQPRRAKPRSEVNRRSCLKMSCSARACSIPCSKTPRVSRVR